MKANNKRKVFGDAVDLLMDEIEEREVPRGVQLIQIKNIQPFHDHPFHLYEGERLEDMIASVKEHGILNPVIVHKIDVGYEKLDSEESIRKWNRGELPVALIHPASAGHGLNLQTGGIMLIISYVL